MSNLKRLTEQASKKRSQSSLLLAGFFITIALSNPNSTAATPTAGSAPTAVATTTPRPDVEQRSGATLAADKDENAASQTAKQPTLLAQNALKNVKAGKQSLNVDKDGVILKGYDPVAYFQQGKSVKGNPKNSMLFPRRDLLFRVGS